MLGEPVGDWDEVCGGGERAFLMCTRGVVVKVEMHVERKIVSRILDRSQDFCIRFAACTGGVQPTLGSCETISGYENELLCACFSDCVDHGLVVHEYEFGGHVVRFVHEAEDYVGVREEARGEFGPEGGELGGSGCFWVGGIADDRAG